MKTSMQVSLESMLATYVPLSILKPEYVGCLSSKVITDDKSNRWVRNSDVALFMMSEFRTTIDRNQQHMVKKRSVDDMDDNYVEKDERWK